MFSRLTDVLCSGRAEAHSVNAILGARPNRLTVSLTSTRPPEGTLAIDGSPDVPFSGWLGLVSLLWQLIDPEDAGDADRPDRHVVEVDGA